VGEFEENHPAKSTVMKREKNPIRSRKPPANQKKKREATCSRGFEPKRNHMVEQGKSVFVALRSIRSREAYRLLATRHTTAVGKRERERERKENAGVGRAAPFLKKKQHNPKESQKKEQTRHTCRRRRNKMQESRACNTPQPLR